MNGFIAKTVTGLGLAGLALATGCYGYRDLVDPCYPERYDFAARQEVKASFAPQVQNGHILDQTMWNYHFDAGTAALTPGGMEHLAYLARRRPCPDPTIYLEVAQDITYDPANFATFVEARNVLDTKRIQAVQDYLTAQTAGRGLSFNVVRHDPDDVSISGVEVGTSVRQLQTSAQGILVKPTVGSGTAASGGGR